MKMWRNVNFQLVALSLKGETQRRGTGTRLFQVIAQRKSKSYCLPLVFGRTMVYSGTIDSPRYPGPTSKRSGRIKHSIPRPQIGKADVDDIL